MPLNIILCLTCPSHSSVPNGTSGDVPWCPSAQSSVPLVHPIFQSPMDIWDIRGRPMVSLSTNLCTTCPSHPAVTKGHMGHRGTYHGVPQHNSVSHLSIPFLSLQGTYGTSRDVPRWDLMGCPSLSVHPLVQRPTGGTLWNVPSLSVHPLGTEGWNGQLGQRPLWDVRHCPYIPWGLRDGTDSWDRGLQVGLHGIAMYILLFSVPCYRTHGSSWTVDGNTGQPSKAPGYEASLPSAYCFFQSTYTHNVFHLR